MGNRRSASGWKKWEKTTKSERREIARNHEAVREAKESFRKQPTGVRCAICNHLFRAKLQPVRSAGGVVVPGCPRCARAAREAQKAPDSLPQERPTVITTRRPAQGDLGALGLLMRAAFVRSGDLPLLPAVTPIRNADFRPIRRQLALMVGARPRYIPSGPVMAMGPGDKPSPYNPEAIEKWHQKWLRELDEALALSAAYTTADGNMSGREKHHLNWEMTNAVQRMQHAAFVFANLTMAV